MTPLRFGPFVLDEDSERLTRSGDPIHLPPQAMSTLKYLIAHAGKLVTREQLRDHIWGTRVAEYDQGINFCVSQIRQALGDDATEPTYLETVPRRGYRFIHPVVGRTTFARGGIVWVVVAVVAVAVAAGSVMWPPGTPAVEVVIDQASTQGRPQAVQAAGFERALRESLASRGDLAIRADIEAADDAFHFDLTMVDSGGVFVIGILLSRGGDTLWSAVARGAETDIAGLRDALVDDANRVMTEILAGTPRRQGETELIRSVPDVPLP